MDIEALMTQQGMRDWTDNQRDTFVNDAVQVRQLAQIVQARLAHNKIEGDRAGSAGRRARKVSKRLAKVARMLEKAAAETEAVNAIYVQEVLELPERRAKQLEDKANRRQRLGIAASSIEAAAAKSLTKSVTAFNGAPIGNPQVTPVQTAPQYVHPMPFQHGPAAGSQQPAQNIADLFPEAL